jgi:DNA-binding HxlR family transcriptional regulator
MRKGGTPVSNDFDTVQHLLPLASQRYAVDVLDALSERPHTYAELRKFLRAHRRGLDDAMRALTTHGAIRRSGHGGSWDQRAPGSTRYQLTLPANGARVTVGRFAAVGGLNRNVEPG